MIKNETVRFSDQRVVTFCTPRHPWGRLRKGGAIHFVDRAILRWYVPDGSGLARLGFISICGRQAAEGIWMAAETPTTETGCRQCRAKMKGDVQPPAPVCDPIDDIQDHHDWDYETHPLGICRRCGALSQAWEE